MSSEEAEEVTAMKRVSKSATAPCFPSRATAAKGAVRPEEIWDAAILFGYFGYAGSLVSPTAVDPRGFGESEGYGEPCHASHNVC